MPEDLWSKMISFLAGEPESDRKILLRQTMKDLSGNRFIKFFRPKTEEADSSLAAFFYNIYRLTFQVRVFMQNEEKMAGLRQKIVESFMDLPILEIVKRLDADVLARRAATEAPAQLTGAVQADIGRLVAGFGGSRTEAVNRRWNLALILSQLVCFDYPGLLKQFDTTFIGGNFAVEPKFNPVKIELIHRQLGEFLATTHAFKPEDGWKDMLGLLALCAGKEMIQFPLFTALAGDLRDIHQSRILDLMVQYCLKNPAWIWKPRIPGERAAEAWLEAKKAGARRFIEMVDSAHRTSQIAVLVKQVFGGAASLTRLEYYTSAQGEIYRRKNLEYFLYADGLNYLKIFLDDYLDKEYRELGDLLLVRGQWTKNNLSKEMSEALHALAGLTTPIMELDQTMSEDGRDGSRLRAAVQRVDRDRSQIRYINSIIGNNNGEALELINGAAQHCIVIGKQLKMLTEDIQKRPAELIINWKELAVYSKMPLAQRMADDCKKLNYFVQLMRLCTVVPGGE